MRLRGLVVSLLVVALTGCGSGGGTGGGSAGGTGGGSGGGGSAGGGSGGGTGATPVHQVPDSECPEGWAGLTVTTDDEAEIEYLDDMTACTNIAQDTTYLKNGSEAVWALRAIGSTSGLATPVDETLGQLSFTQVARTTRGGGALLVPGATSTVDLPPWETEWVIDLPLSIAWEAHTVVLGKIESLGYDTAVAALRRRSQAGAALAVCTQAVMKYADTVSNLEEADATGVLLAGLGVGVASSACQREANAVPVVSSTGQPVSLADDLQRLDQQTAVLGAIETRVSWTQRAVRVLKFGIRFARR